MIVLSLLVAAPLPTLGQSAGQVGETVRVNTIHGLLLAIGPGKTVVLDDGVYDLSGARDVTSSSVSWRETEAGDDYELVLTGVDGLTLKSEGKAWIITPPPYSWVLTIVDSRQVRIEDLGIAHSEQGFCVGGVLRLERCDQVTLRGLDLYGSGTLGLLVLGSSRIDVANSTIRECTLGAVSIEESRDVQLDAVRITANDGYPLISVVSSKQVAIRDSYIDENTGSLLIWVDEESDRVSMAGTYVTDNAIEMLTEEGSRQVDFGRTSFNSNSFDDQGAEEWDGENGASEYVEDGYNGVPDEAYYEEEYPEGN